MSTSLYVLDPALAYIYTSSGKVFLGYFILIPLLFITVLTTALGASTGLV